ncbi:hypothetical protein AAKU67_001908 [Oxalobacteraceae bacterium GrIS 2.11]
MVQTIGSNLATGASSSGSALPGLEAQLKKYQKQLSECVNCDSSKTTEGKAQIQSISSSISDVKARIDKVTGGGNKTPAHAVNAPAEINNSGVVALPTGKATGDAGPTAAISALGSIGSNVNVRA